jgi:hypothetical protein
MTGEGTAAKKFDDEVDELRKLPLPHQYAYRPRSSLMNRSYEVFLQTNLQG